MRPFVVTIDTEGDDLWSRPHDISTRNAAFARRFQHLCEAFGLRPTWLVNHGMAHSAVFTTRVNRSAKGYAGANALVVRRMSVCIRATTVLVPEPDDNTAFPT